MGMVKTALYELWEKYDFKEKIVVPFEIFSFLKEASECTNGKLNVDFYDGGYADALCKVEYINGYFYLYWKDFEKDLKRFDQLSTLEKMNIQIFGGDTYVYKIMDIRSLDIFSYKNNVFILIKCNYATQKEFYKAITERFQISKDSIEETQYGHYIELSFVDNNQRGHSCKIMPFPIFSVLIQEKITPLDLVISRKIMDNFFINEFEEICLDWQIRMRNVKNYEDDRAIKNLSAEIRTETERLLKYFILSNEENWDIKDFEKCFYDLLKNYGDVRLGRLKKVITQLEIPSKFIPLLNVFAHDNGKMDRLH